MDVPGGCEQNTTSFQLPIGKIEKNKLTVPKRERLPARRDARRGEFVRVRLTGVMV